MSKKKIIRLSIEAFVCVVMIIVFIIVNKKIDDKNAKKDTEGYRYSVDALVFDTGTSEITIRGWCLKDGVECNTPDSRPGFKVLLAENGNVEKTIEIPVSSEERQDVAKRYGVSYNYSGFWGSVKTDSDVKDKRYRVIFQYDSSVEKYYYSFNYLNKGELTKEYEQSDYQY